MKKYKVAFIHNIISPYRIPLFEELSAHPLIDLYVYFCAETHKNRKWDVPKCGNFNYSVLSGFTLEFSEVKYSVNPSIVLNLIKGKYDVIIISGNSDFTTHVTYFTSKLLRIPTIWWSEGIESTQSKLGKLISPLTKHIVKNVDAVIVPGSLSKKFHIKLGANPETVFLAPNIVNNKEFFESHSKFKPYVEQFKQKFNFPNKKIILYVGQLIQRKGVEYLIDAYALLKNEYNNVCLVIVGDGVLKRELEKKCHDLHIQDIVFTGWVSEDQKIMYYSISDLFVLPTLEDVWGLVINEAMCCGLPVISTTKAGCSTDMITPSKNGYIVESSKTDQLYSAMKKIVESEDLRIKMSEKSLEIIKTNFSMDNMIFGFVSAIEHCCFSNVK